VVVAYLQFAIVRLLNQVESQLGDFGFDITLLVNGLIKQACNGLAGGRFEPLGHAGDAQPGRAKATVPESDLS
jgi:hypothetical protein